MPADSVIDAAAWSGRQQAFAVVASHCTAAQAHCLREIRDSRAYQQFGLSWTEFCPKHAGISRVYADRLIQRLDEFGEAYFKLSQLAHVSTETYRQIADRVHGDVIEIDGDQLSLTPENAPRIRQAIRALHSRVCQAESKAHRSVVELQMRLDALLTDFSKSADRGLPIDELAAFRGLSSNAAARWRALSKRFAAAIPL